MATPYTGPTFPLAAPAAGMPLTDPPLGYLLSYLYAVLPELAETAWASVITAEPLIRTANYWDPEEGPFDDDMLPGLFAWRPKVALGVNNDWTSDTDGERTTESDFVIMWVLPPADEEEFGKMHPFLNGIADSLDYALRIGRHASWVVAGDPDATALTMGSVMPRWCGWTKYELRDVTRATIDREYTDSPQIDHYQGFRAVLRTASVVSTAPTVVNDGTNGGNVWPNRYHTDIKRTDGVIVNTFVEPVPDQ